MRQGTLIPFNNADYAEMRTKQQEAVVAVHANLSKELMFLGSHSHVITLGRRTDKSNLLETPGSELTIPPIFEVERGGDVTYHGPGQLVGYPILRLGEKRNLHQYLRNLEEVMILTLEAFNIKAGRKKDYTGVWVGGETRKIASIGIAVRHWITYHGFALNVDTDLNYFSLLNPCGLDASVMTSMSRELNEPMSIEKVIPPLLKSFAKVFEITFSPPAA